MVLAISGVVLAVAAIAGAPWWACSICALPGAVALARDLHRG